jgi:multisubunit Na+/H+ antiporter MnhC subunit
MKWDWKNDRRMQFAVGLALLVMGISWLFTGDLLYSINILRGEAVRERIDNDGNVSSVPVPTSVAVTSLVVDFAVGAIVAIGAWVLNLGGIVYSKLAGSPSSQPVADKSTVMPVAESEDDRTRKLVVALATAAQANDREKMDALRIELRLPKAMDELQEAYRAGDLELAASLNAELQEMIAGPKTTPKRKGVANG